MREAKRVRGGAPFAYLSDMAQDQSISPFRGLSVAVNGKASCRHQGRRRWDRRPHIIALNLALMPEAWAGLLFLVVRHAPPEVGSTRTAAVEIESADCADALPRSTKVCTRTAPWGHPLLPRGALGIFLAHCVRRHVMVVGEEARLRPVHALVLETDKSRQVNLNPNTVGGHC